MGRERTWAGKHLHIYVAYLILVALLPGCSNPIRVTQHLRRGQEYLRAGDYAKALIENQSALRLRGEEPPADQVLFNIAMIYANPQNAGRDYQRSLEYLDLLDKRFPDSSYTEIGRVWRTMVNESKKLAREVAKRRLMLKRAWDENREISKLLREHNVEIEESENEKRKLNEELEKLNQIILESQRVDIEIEAKKRESTQ